MLRFLLSADDLKTQAPRGSIWLGAGFRDATHSDTCTKEGCSHYMPGSENLSPVLSIPSATADGSWQTAENPSPCCTDDPELYCWRGMMVIPYTGFLSIPILRSLLFRDTNYTNIWLSCCGHHENNCKVVSTSLQILTSWSRMALKYSNSLVDFSAVYWYF